MNRQLTYFIGPETTLAILSAAVFWICARHNSGECRDIAIMEKLVMSLPFLVVPIVFATLFVPGAKTWWWLGRTIPLTFLMLMICSGRIISGFGSGAKGQDAAFIMVIIFGTIAVSLAASVAAAMILSETRPAFADWFRGRKILGSFLTLLSAVPIGAVLGIIVTVGVAIFAAAYSGLKR
jgi:hypothetical protein